MGANKTALLGEYRSWNHCALHCTRLQHCTALQCTVLHYTALHCTALHCTVLHCTLLQSIALDSMNQSVPTFVHLQWVSAGVGRETRDKSPDKRDGIPPLISGSELVTLCDPCVHQHTLNELALSGHQKRCKQDAKTENVWYIYLYYPPVSSPIVSTLTQ